MNFTYSMVYSIDNAFGTKLQNGKANGVIGMIFRNEVDIGIAAFYVTEERSQIVDLSVIFDLAENKFFIASPGQDLGGFFSFIQGFRKDAWLASLTFVFALPVFFTFVYYALSFFQLIEVTSWNYGWNL